MVILRGLTQTFWVLKRKDKASQSSPFSYSGNSGLKEIA